MSLFDLPMTLPMIWALLLGVAVFMYILLDGFDLGVGVLFPFAATDTHRDTMMGSVAPVWDGNETWLVLGGGGLFAAFPKAYAALMPAVYMPIGFMLIALVFRGVAFEFRFASTGVLRRLWDQAFHWGSVVAAFSQGLILGAMVQGINLQDGRFAGGMFDWLTPFSFFTGCALVWGYALLGATWLIMKTDGDLARWARQVALVAVLFVIVCLAIVSVCVPLLDSAAAQRWGIDYPHLDWGRLLPLTPLPVITAIVCWLLLRAVRDADALWQPFVYSIVIFLLSYLGLVISFFPYIVPYSLTITEAAAAPNSQALLLVGALILLPLILAYTAYIYWVFRGKTEPSAAYH